jgi:hypothetical protein
LYRDTDALVTGRDGAKLETCGTVGTLGAVTMRGAEGTGTSRGEYALLFRTAGAYEAR